MRRWLSVAAAGVGSGLVLAWVLWALTRAAVLAVIVGSAVAAILVGLAVAGIRQNSRFATNASHEAEARVRRARVDQAMAETRHRTPNLLSDAHIRLLHEIVRERAPELVPLLASVPSVTQEQRRALEACLAAELVETGHLETAEADERGRLIGGLVDALVRSSA
jgi:hypothetical protein